MSKENPDFNLETYSPKSIEEVEFVPSPLPVNEFEDGKFSNFQPVMFKNGLIVININHVKYPDAICQVQMFPRKGDYHIFFFHGSPSANYIPDLLAEKIALNDAIPHTLNELDNMFPKSDTTQ